MAKEEKKELEDVVAPTSSAKKEFQKIIDAYKVRNPVKYELKKKELEAKLAAIK